MEWTKLEAKQTIPKRQADGEAFGLLPYPTLSFDNMARFRCSRAICPFPAASVSSYSLTRYRVYRTLGSASCEVLTGSVFKAGERFECIRFERHGPHGHRLRERLRVPKMREPESSGPGVIETPSSLAETDTGYVQTASKLDLSKQRHDLALCVAFVAFCLITP